MGTMNDISETMLNDGFFSEPITWFSSLAAQEDDDYTGTTIRAIFEYSQSSPMVFENHGANRVTNGNIITSDEYAFLKEDHFVIDGIKWTLHGEPSKDREGMQQFTLIHTIEKIKGRF